MFMNEAKNGKLLVGCMQEYFDRISNGLCQSEYNNNNSVIDNPFNYFNNNQVTSTYYYSTPINCVNTQSTIQQSSNSNNRYVSNYMFDPYAASSNLQQNQFAISQPVNNTRAITKSQKINNNNNRNNDSIMRYPSSLSSTPPSSCESISFNNSSIAESSISSTTSRSLYLSSNFVDNSQLSSSSVNKQKKQLPIRSAAIDKNELMKESKKCKKSRNMYCTFCYNNKEKEQIYKSHILKDSNGKTVCPVLKLHTCPICGATGEDAHTITYCKQFKNSKRQQYLTNQSK